MHAESIVHYFFMLAAVFFPSPVYWSVLMLIWVLCSSAVIVDSCQSAGCGVYVHLSTRGLVSVFKHDVLMFAGDAPLLFFASGAEGVQFNPTLMRR